MTQLQMEIIAHFDHLSMHDIAREARAAWERGNRYFTQHRCSTALRLKLDQGNDELRRNKHTIPNAGIGAAPQPA